MTVPGCPVCGTAHVACGAVGTVTGVDQNILEVSAVGELRQYEVTVNGNTTVLNLSEDEAKRLGGRPVGATTAKHATSAHASDEKARTAPANKARTNPGAK